MKTLRLFLTALLLLLGTPASAQSLLNLKLGPGYKVGPAAMGTAAVWKYRAIYLQGDQPFGQWSDTATLAVQG